MINHFAQGMLFQTERFYFRSPNAGVLVDVFKDTNRKMWHATAIAESSEWRCQNGFGTSKEDAIKQAVNNLLDSL